MQLQITIAPQKKGRTIVEEEVNLYVSVNSVVETEDARRWDLKIKDSGVSGIDYPGVVVSMCLVKGGNKLHLEIDYVVENEDGNGLVIERQYDAVILEKITVKDSVSFPSPVNRPQSNFQLE